MNGSPREKMANVVKCNIVENKVELKYRYYVYFRTNILEKGMNSFFPRSNLLNIIDTVLQWWLWL